MRFVSTVLLPLALIVSQGCGQMGNTDNPGNNGGTSTPVGSFSQPLPITGTESNVLRINVGCGYINEPCVSVTLCKPGGTVGVAGSCVTIPNILIDTGSSGLRVFSSLVPFTLSPATGGGQPMGECISYADGSSDWGGVYIGDVVLGNGNERAQNVPVQLINSTYAQIPSDCTQPDTSPANQGFNGILGLGLFKADCGANCASDSNNRIYFSCPSGQACTGIAVAEAQQVQNPVLSMPSDNNGVILQIPAIAATGASSASGYVIMGIGTQADNTPPGGVTVFNTDANGNFITTFNGSTSSQAFIDSGSNGLYFDDSSLTQCTASSADSGLYCPTSLTTLSAIQINAAGTKEANVAFQVGNADAALNSNLGADPTLAGQGGGAFDWGLPFFFGKTVYVGGEGKASSLGSGTYWAY